MERKWWTLVSVCVATLMLLIDVTIVNVALPDIQKSLHSSFSDVQWVIDAYSLMLAALLLTAGSLADMFGRRLVFVAGLVVFTVSSLLSGLASTPLFLNLARGAQGIGGAMLFATSLALLAQSFRGRERGIAFGVWGAITGIAVAIGPVIGGALTSGLTWRWIFLVNVPIGVAAVFVTLARVDESRAPVARRPDYVGLITFSGGLGAIVYALIKSNTLGWGSTTIIACLAGGGALLIAFVIAELVQRQPMFDLRLFRKPTFVGGSVAAFALSAGMFSLLLYITLYLQDILAMTPLQAGLRLLIVSGGIILTSTIAGRLTAHVPIRLLIAPGLGMVAIGILLMRGLSAGSSWTHLIPGFIVAGMGVGMVNPPLASTAVGVVEPQDAGMASGINTTFRQVGIATGVAALGSIFGHAVRAKIVVGLTGVSGVSTAAISGVAHGVSQGNPAAALRALPGGGGGPAARVVHGSFVHGLNVIFLIGAIVAGVAALLTLVLIRNKDFTAGAAHDRGDGVPMAPATPEPAGAEPAVPADPDELEPAEPRLDERAATVVAATEQALEDLHARVAEMVQQRQDALLGEAERQAEELRARALAETDRYAAPLRERAQSISSLAARVRAELERRAQHEPPNGASGAAIRAELYRLIGQIGELAADVGRNGAGLQDRDHVGGTAPDGNGLDVATRRPLRD